MSEPVPQAEQPVDQPATVETNVQWQADAPANTEQPAPLPEVTTTAQPASTTPTDVTVIHTHAPGLPYGPTVDEVWFPNKTAVKVSADLAAKVLDMPGFTLADATELAPVRQP